MNHPPRPPDWPEHPHLEAESTNQKRGLICRPTSSRSKGMTEAPDNPPPKKIAASCLHMFPPPSCLRLEPSVLR